MLWTFTADAPAAAKARAAARAFAAEEGADTLAAVALCVSEAVSNAVVHAYRERERPGKVEVEVKRPNGYLCLRVRDHGCGLAPRTDSPGLGLGLPLIAESASSLECGRPAAGGPRCGCASTSARPRTSRVEVAASSTSRRRFSASMRWRFTVEDPATPSRAREAVRAFAADHGADADTLAAVELCVSEAVSNAVVHAYRKLGRRGPVEVEARRPDRYLCVYVRDSGCGLRRREDSPGLGLGLPLIFQTATELDVRTPRDGGTEVVMRFQLSGSSVRSSAG